MKKHYCPECNGSGTVYIPVGVVNYRTMKCPYCTGRTAETNAIPDVMTPNNQHNPMGNGTYYKQAHLGDEFDNHGDHDLM